MNAINRLNSSTEIIPLQGPSMRNDARFRQNFRPKPKPYFVDNLLVPRVKQYLEDHKDNVHVDMDAMVDELMRKYRDYGRRKRNAFKQSVDKAFKAVLAQYNLGGEYDGEDAENTETSDEEMYSEDISLESGSNQVAGQLMNMYMNRPGLSSANTQRMSLQSHYRSAVHGLQHSAQSYIKPFTIKQELVVQPQGGFTIQRRAESNGADKELINISSDEEDEASKDRVNRGKPPNVPSSSGMLPIATSLLPPAPSLSSRGVDSTVPTVSHSVEITRSRADRGPPSGSSVSGGGGGGHGGSGSVRVPEPPPARPWPALTPAASSTPRQQKRPRPPGSSEPSITITTSGGAVSKNTAAGRDSPAVKRRRSIAPPLDLQLQDPFVTFADLGGIDDVLEEVGRLLSHLRHPEVFETLGVPPPRGVLLHGPPGCGKSLLAQAVAGELELPLLRVAGPELVAGVSGESEARVRELFDQAVQCAPCVLFLDEVDALAPPRAGAQREMERRIVAQLLSCMDELGRTLPDGQHMGEVLVLGATSRPEALDPALRRAGRFDREISLGIPDARAREGILRILCRTMRLAPDIDLRELVKCTPGFVGADLQALTREAALAAVSRVLDEEEQKIVEQVIKQDCDKKSRETKKQEKPEEGKEKLKEEITAKPQESKEAKKTENEASDDNKVCKDDVSKEENREIIQDVEMETTKEEAKVPSKDDAKKSSKEEASDSMEVIDICDTPKLETSQTPAAKADSSVPKVDCVDEDEVCIEAEVSSSDTAAKVKTQNVVSSADGNEDMEVLDEDEDVVSVPGPESQVMKVPVRKSTLTPEQLKNTYITQKDFKTALKHVQPSAKREGFATVPDISWDDVGALRDVREELQMAILAPVRHPEAFEALGLTAPAGLLLCGPPGCGKTLIAKAIANEADINFISVKGPELLNMYVGESEKAVRQCFLRARNSAPCVIFFDELDALCPRRTGGPSGEGNSATQRVVNQLLTEMDGVEGRRGVFLLAASNRPDILDPAVLRPGRLDRVVFVGLPGPEARADILRALTRNGTKPQLAADVDLQLLGESTELDGCSGADLASLVREAATLALREHLCSIPLKPSNQQLTVPAVTQDHFSQAVKRLRPSVSPLERIRYEKLRLQFSTPQAKETSLSCASQTLIGETSTNTSETQTEANGGKPPTPSNSAAPDPCLSA